MRVLRIALVGDYDRTAVAHQAIPPALVLAGKGVGVAVDAQWVATDTIYPSAPAGALTLGRASAPAAVGGRRLGLSPP